MVRCLDAIRQRESAFGSRLYDDATPLVAFLVALESIRDAHEVLPFTTP